MRFDDGIGDCSRIKMQCYFFLCAISDLIVRAAPA